ncbi:MAG: hypothetical protein AAB134_01380 [Pseudomonadota bacterium]
MRLARIVVIIFTLMTDVSVFGAEPEIPAAAPQASEPAPARRHQRPTTVRCLPTINAWVEADNGNLPKQHTITESKKRVALTLVDSSASRGESVMCSYASRSRDVTTSYSVQCTQPRKERGQPHTYSCR